MAWNFETEIDSMRQILEVLDDSAIKALRGFMESGTEDLKIAEKRIHKVRRALMRAIAELEDLALGKPEDF